MIQLRGPYRKRPIRFLSLEEANEWRIKVYGIRYAEGEVADRPDAEIVDRAVSFASPHLPSPAVTASRYGLGFIIIHQGESRVWLLLHWWFDQEILKQRLFSSAVESPFEFSEAESDLMACTWEMAVHVFERQAWLDTVLANAAGPDVEAYLGRRMNADV